MSATTETGSRDSVSLSLRLSCDRCRAQKLKCTVQAGYSTCQRCKRAKAPCVFGRRTASKRRLSRTERGERGSASPSVPPGSPMPPSPVATPRPPPPPSALESVSTCPGLTPDTQLDGPMGFEAAIIPEMESGCFVEVSAPWGSLGMDLGLQGLGPDISDCAGSDAAGCDWFRQQSAWSVDESTTMFDFGELDLASMWSQLTTATTSGPAAYDNAVSGGSRSYNGATLPVQRLTELVAQIQHQLRKLEGGPWHTDNTCSLDDYPVGTVLSLAQQFSAIVRPLPIFSGASRQPNEESCGKDEDGLAKHDSTSPVGLTNDTSTMLLVMCGYMWLVRTYGVVLDHFQKHLHQRSANQHLASPARARRQTSYAYCGMVSPTDGAGDSSSCIPALRLGELPCADATLGLQQIHTAVRMLLDALHDIENHLGRDAAVAREMAVALLLQSGKAPDGRPSGLGKKATAVKELLRQKMGL